MQPDNVIPLFRTLPTPARVTDIHTRYRYKLARLNEQNTLEYRHAVCTYAEIPNGWVYVERSPA